MFEASPGNSSRDPISLKKKKKNQHKKRAGGVAQGESPELIKKKKERKKERNLHFFWSDYKRCSSCFC
jgi:hypothetical protein